MPSREQTVVAAIAASLGLLGFPSLTMGERARPSELIDVDHGTWTSFTAGRSHPEVAPMALGAYRLGRSLLDTEAGLRWRRPHRIARTTRTGGDADPDAIGADLSVDDHLAVRLRPYRGPVRTTRPARLFDELLAEPGPAGRNPHHRSASSENWFELVAPREYDAFLGAVRILGGVGPGRLDPALLPWARPLWLAIAHASSDRWRAALARTSDLDSAVLRLLGIGTYSACVASPRGGVYRIPSQWEWRQRFEVRRLSVFPVAATSARVGFELLVGERGGRDLDPVEGQVDLRWTGGWLVGTPAARLSLRTPWTSLPAVRSVV